MLSSCLHLSSSTLYLLITAVILFNYDLECVTNLDIAYISYSAHILFDYKLVFVIFVFESLNIHRCFTHYLNFQYRYIYFLNHTLMFKYTTHANMF